MDKKSKILLLAFLVLVTVVVAFTYYRYMIKRDYVIEAQADCDPYAEACFIWQCDPKSSEEGEACTGDPEEDIWYYKIVKRNAMNVPLCDPNDEECDALTCEPALEKDCEIILCDEETAIEQETECNDPEEYALENPYECDPEEDEECVLEEEDLSAEEAESENGEEDIEEEGEENLTDESADSSEEE